MPRPHQTISHTSALTNRIFIPPTHKPGQTLPLYLNIHGGGFALCNPSFDDEWCAHFCNTYGILVVSLDYFKAPPARFPIPVDDVEELVKAVLSDDSLSIDKGRVVMGGFSAGGNLALSVAQGPDLRGRIHGVVPWYPVTDFTIPGSEKIKSRPKRNEKDVDILAGSMPMFNWGYITPGQDLGDSRLSVRFAGREELPKWIFMIGRNSICCVERRGI
jgi:acetyl esterase/lipase